jgi:hypothetical protein
LSLARDRQTARQLFNGRYEDNADDLGALLNIAFKRAVDLIERVARKDALKISNRSDGKMVKFRVAAKKASDVDGPFGAKVGTHLSKLKAIVEDAEEQGLILGLFGKIDFQKQPRPAIEKFIIGLRHHRSFERVLTIAGRDIVPGRQIGIKPEQNGGADEIFSAP